MELHGHTWNDADGTEHTTPITITLIRPAELGAYKDYLAKSNPDYRHATLGQTRSYVRKPDIPGQGHRSNSMHVDL